ncbi:MAG: cupin domain-containing protein [Acidimicrobiales bacterium]
MDALTSLLQGPRARGAFVIRMVMEPPWAVSVEDRAPLTVAAVLAGSAWATTADGEVRRLQPGQIGILRGPDPYVFADDPSTPPRIVVHPGLRCEDHEGRSLKESFTRGIRTWGNQPDGGTVIIIGTYEQIGEPGHRLLSELPPLAVIQGEEIGTPVVDLIAAEITREAPGQDVVLDRLLDLLTVSALRCWFDRAGADAPRWWQATADPVVGPALRLLQNNPAHRWTVAALAAEVGVSRAVMARQFTALVGQPPMTFLTDWRLALAADLLLEPDATVQSVADRVGYGTGFALSTAFKRVHGVSPSAHRRRVAAA